MKKPLAVAGIGIGVMALGMMWAIVNTALSSIQKDLSANIHQLQWMMNLFGICLCVPLLAMGKLGDMYGRRRLFTIGLIVTVFALLFAGMAKNIVTLIGCMGLIGLASSLILPLSQALLVHEFPESRKEKAIGLWGVFASISLAIGPLVGGAIVSALGWRWIYWAVLPLPIISIILIATCVKKDQTNKKSHCDWIGVAFLATIVGSLIVAIMEGPTWGWLSFEVLGLFALALVALCIFVWLEQRTSVPLFRPDLFSHRGFLFSAIPNGCLLGYVWVAFFMIPLYLQNLQGISPFATGLAMLSVTLPVAFLSVPVSKWYKKIGPKPLILTGFSLLMMASIMQIFLSDGSFPLLILSCFCFGLGWVIAWGPSISCALSSLPHSLAGMASGMFTTMQELGAIVSLSIAGVIFRQSQTTHLMPYQDHIHAELSYYPPETIDSLSSNPTAVEQILGASSDVVPYLRTSFVDSYHDVFWFLLVLSVLAAALALFLPNKK